MAVFVHLSAGLVVLAAVAHLSRIRSRWLTAVAALLVGAVVAVLITDLGLRLVRRPDLLYLGLLGGHVVILLLLRSQRGDQVARLIQPKAAVDVRPWVYTLLVTAAAIVSAMPHASPLNMNPRGLIGGLRCTDPATPFEWGPEGRGHTDLVSAEPALVEWAARALPAGAALAVNVFNAYPLPALLPQHVVVWPVAASGNVVDARLVSRVRRAVRAHAEVLRGPTVLQHGRGLVGARRFPAGPRCHAHCGRPALSAAHGRHAGAEAFPVVYDDSGWTVYEVKLPGGRPPG